MIVAYPAGANSARTPQAFDGDYIIVNGDWTIVCKGIGRISGPINIASLSSHYWTSIEVQKDPST